MTVQITGGVTFTGGSKIDMSIGEGVGYSFTISDTDFSASAYQGPGITDFGGSIGLLSDGLSELSNANYGILRTAFISPKLSEILAYFAANSLVTDGSFGYNFSVSGTGGASNITKIVLGLDSNTFIIAPADPEHPAFGVDGSVLSSIVNATGILAFPVTFTLDSPLITHPGSWY